MNSRSTRRLERRLRDDRPQAPEALVRSVASRVGPRRSGVPRLALGTAMTALMLVALGSVGGLTYAAGAANGAFKAAKQAFQIDAGKQAIKVTGINAGGDQYRPGYGFGDPNHNHTGPPGLERSGGAAAPPLRAQNAGKLAKRVLVSVSIDEQAALFISVLNKSGKKLLLTQNSRRGGSSIGQGTTGPQTKTIRYTLLVPRSIPLSLRIPANLIRAGQTYTIRIIAIDPSGKRSILRIPFTG